MGRPAITIAGRFIYTPNRNQFTMTTKPIDIRSGVHASNLQEVIDASANGAKATLAKGQAQYQTPAWLADAMTKLLPCEYATNVIDPQCAGGNLLASFNAASTKFGIELDNRFDGKDRDTAGVHLITSNCVHVGELLTELFPESRFGCIVANPPFGLKWKQGDGKPDIDSTQWTWDFIKSYISDRGFGYMIANAPTMERLGITKDPIVYLYQRFPAGGIWPDCNVEIGVVHFHNIDLYKNRTTPAATRVWSTVPDAVQFSELKDSLSLEPYYTPYAFGGVAGNWNQIARVIDDEKRDRPKWNIYLNKDGMLKTYLSTMASIKMSRKDTEKLVRVNNCHPLTLTTEKELRDLLNDLLTSGVYTMQPEARTAIDSALKEAATIACPILPVTNFELVAYAHEEETLVCKTKPTVAHAVMSNTPTPATAPGTFTVDGIKLTAGKRYQVRSGSYTFKINFVRKKVHHSETTDETTIEDHDCQTSGQDRYVEITDDNYNIHRFMDRPSKDVKWEHDESLLWKLFNEPYVPTVAEVNSDLYERNIALMRMNEMLAGFTYFPGQLDYYARMGVKDSGVIAADVGTGKTLGALTLIALKSPKRTLIIAPQGTMRSSGDEDEVDYEASQWVKEIRRFAPTEPVFQLFDKSEWLNILHANGGVLPAGIFITYPQAYFANGAFEVLPKSWDGVAEKKFCERYELPLEEGEARNMDECYHRNVGATNDKGIRCIAEPSLATLIASAHGDDAWDMAILDEAHLCCNIEANITKNLLRLQPRYRFALTATPIPNIATNMFSLMGWVCVKDWYKGARRNAAWPYAVDECGRFSSTFLSTEVDFTAQDKARAAGKRGWRNAGTRHSPIISSPARLLKLLKPSMAYISKEACDPHVKTCEVIDVRVAMGKEQSKLYAYWLNRGNYYPEFKSPLTIAQVQSTRLRGICASPASLDYTRGKCRSNFNPKTVTILQLVRDCLRRSEQVVIVSARVGQSQALATSLSDAGVELSRIDSTVAPELHVAEANRFKRGDSRVMLMGIKCAQGHSFDQCPNLIIGSLEWSYGTLHQAKGRVWRLTSKKNVKVWCVLHQNSIEELLFDRVAVKQDSATLCLHGKRVPRDFTTMDANEVIAEHIVNYNAKDGEILSEVECESQWPELREQLIMANNPNNSAEEEETSEADTQELVA